MKLMRQKKKENGMKRKEMVQWALAVVLVAMAAAILKFGPSVTSVHAAEGMKSMAATTECP